MTRWRDVFTARQLLALTTFSDLVRAALERVKCDALAAGLPDDVKLSPPDLEKGLSQRHGLKYELEFQFNAEKCRAF